MIYNYRAIALYAAKVSRIALFCTLILISFSFTQIGEAAPTGQLAYAVNGFDENLGRFDWNLYATAIKDTNDLKAVSLNHKGMYPAWGPNGDLLYFIQWHAGQSDIYSVNPDNPKNKKRVTPISGTYRFLSVSPMVRNSLSTVGQWNNSPKKIRFG